MASSITAAGGTTTGGINEAGGPSRVGGTDGADGPRKAGSITRTGGTVTCNSNETDDTSEAGGTLDWWLVESLGLMTPTPLCAAGPATPAVDAGGLHSQRLLC